MQPAAFLWVIDFDYASRLHHGAMIRFVNYAAELTRLGHRVIFAAQIPAEVRPASHDYFRALRDAGTIADFLEVAYRPARSPLSALLLHHPAWTNRLQRRSQLDAALPLQRYIEEFGVDYVLISSRRLMFLSRYLTPRRAVLPDFCDSLALYYGRSVRKLAGARSWRRAVNDAVQGVYYGIQERYYTRRARRVFVVSPVDRAAIGRLSGQPAKPVIVLNGVQIPSHAPSLVKDPDQLIFTGNMSFPPNHEAALWFLDQVFPRILAERPSTKLVLAGADPPDFLRARQDGRVRVTGFVEDLNREIAGSALFVAPLVSGGGFKNKIVEALANRTYVAATPLAVEFLDPAVRQLIPATSDPVAMAAGIVRLLNHPESYQEKLETLHAYVRDHLSWARSTRNLLALLPEHEM